ncbi:MAG: histidine--tRNA ligase [Candidatus Omnitrophica bacterium]|nr:histidine--tRNA ligase [Candidatus Omnitrophota bacterium]
MSEIFSVPRGTADILPAEIGLWNKVNCQARSVLNAYNYKEIRTPIFEETGLFARSMGQTSDVVQKQMLNLASQAKDEQGQIQLSGLSLRPEGTAAVVRSYIENRLDKKESLTKLFYVGPMFRGERPQKGRLRQFHQIGVEAIGPQSGSPYLDAEVISLSINILKSLGLSQPKLKINTLGSAEDKDNFAKILKERIQPSVIELCPDCQNRFERNVFRILDCKNEACKAVVRKVQIDRSYLSEASLKYYETVKNLLTDLGVVYEESLNLVRGLDYYTHTVFEISDSSLGSQDALGAGGRYNTLVSQLGGPEVEAVGFALGMERIMLALAQLPGVALIEEDRVDFYFVAFDEKTFKIAFDLMALARSQGFVCDMDFRSGSMKAQMRQADKAKARFVMIIGEDEVNKQAVSVKNMDEHSQFELAFEAVKNLRGTEFFSGK